MRYNNSKQVKDLPLTQYYILIIMGYCYNVLEMDYEVRESINKDKIVSLIKAPESDSSVCTKNEEQELQKKGMYKFFDSEEVIEDLREEQLLADVINALEIYDNQIFWNGDSETVSLTLLQFAAWKVFAELGIGDNFICKDIAHWESDTTCNVSVVDKKGMYKYL